MIARLAFRLGPTALAMFLLAAAALPCVRGKEAAGTTTEKATATALTCGQTITSDITLDRGLSCSAEVEVAIMIGASNITLDLGGHVLSGYAPVGKVNRGIVATNISGVTIKNGTVAEFTEGVNVFNSRDVIVENLLVKICESPIPITEAAKSS